MREVVVTKDGSHTLRLPEKGITYHSVNGALQEAEHVFLRAGFHAVPVTEGPLAIFEMGFGTGLNAFLTALAAQDKNQPVHYTAVDILPLAAAETALLNYTQTLGHSALFWQMHQCPWNKEVQLQEGFTLQKCQTTLAAFSTTRRFHLMYYDAFAPSAQPELWTEAVFKKLRTLLQPNGLLVTYCAKGNVRRALLTAGFRVERLPGPAGKREMLRATAPALPGSPASDGRF